MTVVKILNYLGYCPCGEVINYTSMDDDFDGTFVLIIFLLILLYISMYMLYISMHTCVHDQ